LTGSPGRNIFTAALSSSVTDRALLQHQLSDILKIDKILGNEGLKLAVINGLLFQSGDLIHGGKIIGIKDDRVMIKIPGEGKVLELILEK